MALTKTQRLIVEYLATQPDPPERSGQADPGGSTPHGLGPVADASTVRFRRHRDFPGCQLHAVSFRRSGRLWREVVRVDRDLKGGWSVHPVGSGSGAEWCPEQPRVNFTAQAGSEFTAGGDIVGIGVERTHAVQLTFADGAVVEDVVADGIALFFIPSPVAFPARVRLVDRDGKALASYSEFEVFA